METNCPNTSEHVTIDSGNTLTANENNNVLAAASLAANKARTRATEALRDASAEFDNKRRCLEHQFRRMKEHTYNASLTTKEPPAVPFLAKQVEDPIKVGSCVCVSPDLTADMCSYGGDGFVTQVQRSPETNRVVTLTVCYLKTNISNGGCTETDIERDRITVIPMPWKEKAPTTRKWNNKYMEFYPFPTNNKCSHKLRRPLREHLQEGFLRNLGKGFRHKHFEGPNFTRFDRDTQILVDLEVLEEIRKTEENSGLKLLRNNNGCFKPRPTKFECFTVKYLAKAWGISRRGIYDIKKRRDEIQHSHGQNPTNQSPIESIQAANIFYSPRNMYVNWRANQLQEERAYETEIIGESAGGTKRSTCLDIAKANWTTLSSEEREVWNCRSRSQLAQQPFVRDQIINSLRRNPNKSFEKVAADIGHWCHATSVSNWFAKQESASYYGSMVVPLLTGPQKQRHVEFAKKVTSRWSLPPQKILWIHYDEKWFFGLVLRASEKRMEVLGLDYKYYQAYHMNYINKVMAIAVTAYAFDGSVENGGDGIKIGFYRAEAAKVAKKIQRKGRRDENGNIRYDGEIVRNKGDTYMVDVCVTGSNEGTSDNPKFALKRLFESCVFPRIDELVGPGGPYEGYLPIIQGDNAGPHCESDFYHWCINTCLTKGWRWEPQAPQMPHANNLDLVVFPMMSKRHSDLLREYSNSVASPNMIWESAYKVWSDMPSSKIARGFVLAYRVMQQVIKNKGCNKFLRSGGLHNSTRKDFPSTATGIEPQDE